MNLENLIAVSGLPGIFSLVANRNNGLIIEDLDSGKKRFAPARKHQFTPLASIAIYTDDGDSTELKNVFRNMLDQLEDNPPVNPNGSTEEIVEYFTDVLPNYDRDKVTMGDIKKVIKWFTFLHEKDLLSADEQEETSSSDEEE